MILKPHLHKALKSTYERFIKIRGNPRKIALGFALGIFIGLTPSMGFQMGVAVFLAALLKWNKISAATGVWITNPLTAVPIYGFTYMVGVKVLHFSKIQNFSPEFTTLSIQTLLQKAPKVLAAMTLGGVVVGLPLSILTYFLSYKAVLNYQDKIKQKVQNQKIKLRRAKNRIKQRIPKKKKKAN